MKPVMDEVCHTRTITLWGFLSSHISSGEAQGTEGANDVTGDRNLREN